MSKTCTRGYDMNLYLKALLCLSALFCTICIGGVIAEKIVDEKSSESVLPVQFFYDSTCGSCEKVVPFIDGFAANHTGVTVEKYDIFQNKTNDDLFNSLKNSTGTTEAYVPVVFVGNLSIVGDEKIEKDLGTTVTSALANLSQKN